MQSTENHFYLLFCTTYALDMVCGSPNVCMRECVWVCVCVTGSFYKDMLFPDISASFGASCGVNSATAPLLSSKRGIVL